MSDIQHPLINKRLQMISIQTNQRKVFYFLESHYNSLLPSSQQISQIGSALRLTIVRKMKSQLQRSALHQHELAAHVVAEQPQHRGELRQELELAAELRAPDALQQGLLGHPVEARPALDHVVGVDLLDDALDVPECPEEALRELPPADADLQEALAGGVGDRDLEELLYQVEEPGPDAGLLVDGVLQVGDYDELYAPGQGLRVPQAVDERVAEVGLDELVVGLVLLVLLQQRADQRDTFDEERLRLFVRLFPELSIELPGQQVGFSVGVEGEVGLAQGEDQLCVAVEPLEVLDDHQLLSLEKGRQSVLKIIIGKVDLANKKVVFPHPLRLSLIQALLYFKGLDSVRHCLRVEVRVVHIVLGQGSTHPHEDWMRLPQPFSGTVLDKPDRLQHELGLVLYEPLDLGQMTFKREAARQVDLIQLAIELMILLRCNEVEKILADLLVNWVVLEHEEVGFSSIAFFGHHFTEFSERFCALLAETIVNLLKSHCKVEVVDHNTWQEPNKIGVHERVGTLEENSLVNVVAELYLQMVLDSLQEEVNVDVFITLLPQ